MIAPLTSTITALQLVERLRAYGPSVEGVELVFDSDVPEELWRVASILQTGVRAVLLARRWFGIDEHGRACGPYPSRGDGPLAFGALDPSEPIPLNTRLLSIEGVPGWDRIRATAFRDYPQLFATEPRVKGVK